MKLIRNFSFTMAIIIILILFAFVELSAFAQCTDIVVGKKASTDGSVITSHTCDEGGPAMGPGLGGGSGVGYDARIRVILGQDWPAGTMVPIYRQACEVGPQTQLEQVGEIPEAEHTYTYFHVAYPFLNEHQIAIGETTIAQREELMAGDDAIMTIEQLEKIALQRCKTAREAVQLMGELGEKYGFHPSCWIMGECVTVTDPNEAWVFEIYSVGPLWSPKSGDSGAIWAARRVPDDEVCVIPNISRIGVIEEGNPDFMYSSNYQQVAIDKGWYDPKGGEPFNITLAYTPETGDWSADSIWVRNRLWYVYQDLCPSENWDHYAPLTRYPFSVKPEGGRKLSVKDVIGYQKTTFNGTDWSLDNFDEWYVTNDKGEKVKSPLATPWITDDLSALLSLGNKQGITAERPISRYNCSYGFVSQVRDWLPNPIGGCLWFFNDNPGTSVHIPVYCGVTELPVSYRTNNRYDYSRDSAWWAFATVDQFVNFRYQDAANDLKEVQEPLQEGFYAFQPAVEEAAKILYERDPELAVKFLTNYTNSCMNKAEGVYWDLADLLIEKYNNNQY